MTTKLELTQLLAQRNKELEAARLRISVLEGELALRPRNEAATPLKQPRATRTLPSHFAAAREAAMRFGKTVKVEVSHG